MTDPDQMEAGPDLDRAIAEEVLGYSGLGYYGPPAEGPWLHEASVRYDTRGEVVAAIKRLHPEMDAEGAVGGLRYWRDGWGPLAVPDWSSDLWCTDWEYGPDLIEWHRQRGYIVDVLARPDGLASRYSVWLHAGETRRCVSCSAAADTLPLALCRAALKAARAGKL